jgi:hypothetical protein
LVSPSDVRADLDGVERAVFDWNRLYGRNANIQFVPTRWEYDVVPALSGPPQEAINKELVDTADAMIALFWTRLGSRTETHESGTAEEIDRFVARQKRPAVYRCTRAMPSNTDATQLQALNDYESRLRPRGLVFSYDAEGQLARLTQQYLMAAAIELRASAESQATSTAARDAARIANLNHLEHCWADIVYARRQFELAERRKSLTGSIEGDAITPFVNSAFDRMLQSIEETILRLPEYTYQGCEDALTNLRDLRADVSQQHGSASVSLNEAVLQVFGDVTANLRLIESIVLADWRTASAQAA